MDKSLEELAKKRELLARVSGGAAPKGPQKTEGEMSEDMAAFIARKREAEQAPAEAAPTSGAKDDKARRREEIMRKIQERRAAKQAGTAAPAGGDKAAAAKSTEMGAAKEAKSSVVEDLRKRREAEAERRGAEAAKKELAEAHEKALAAAAEKAAAEKAALVQKHSEEIAALKKQQGSADAAAERVAELETQLAAAAAAQEEAVAAVQAEAKAAAEAAAAAAAAEKAELEKANEESLQKAVSELEEAQTKIKEQADQVAGLEQNVADLEELLASSGEQEALEEQLATVQAEHASKLLELEGQLAEERTRAEALATECATLKEQLEAATASHAEKVAELEAAVETEKAAAAAAADNVSAREADSAEATALAEELAKEKERVAALSKENEELIDTLAEMQSSTNTRLAEIEEALNSEKNERERLKEELESKDASASKALLEAEQRKTEIEQLRAEKASLEASAASSPSDTAAAEATRAVSEESPEAESYAADSPAPSRTAAQRQESVDRAAASAGHGFVKELVEEINRLRAGPAAYGEELKEHLEHYDGVTFAVPGESYTVDTREGAKGLEDAIAALATTQPVPNLTLANGLSASCQDLCDSNGPVGLVSDASTDGTTAEARLVRHGKWSGKVNELMSYGPRSGHPKDVVRQWLVDDGNPSKQQRGTLLDPSFTVIGVGHGEHAEFDLMAVVALAQGYTSSDEASAGVVSREKTELRESNDGTCFVITSQPCRVSKENVKVLMKGKTLAVVTKRHDGESVKTFTHQWNLPFAVPVCNVSATYTSATEVEIVIKKRASDVVGGAQSIKTYTLPVADVPNNRLRVDVKQQPHAILFTTEPCACEVRVDLKIVDGMTLCFESVYTEVSDKSSSKETKTITRKETVSLPFSITADRLSFAHTETGGLTVSLLKPSVDTASEISIPLE